MYILQYVCLINDIVEAWAEAKYLYSPSNLIYMSESESELQDTLSQTRTMIFRAPRSLRVGSLEYTPSDNISSGRGQISR